ncbi:MAG: hypothetical protein ACLQGU_03955 [bacterium]
MDQNLITAKRTLTWSLNFMNLDLKRLSEKDLFVLWTEIRGRVYGDQGPSRISDESLVKWEQRRKQGEEIQKWLRGALDTLLNPITHKPGRRVMPSPGQKFHVSALEKLSQNEITLILPFEIEAKRVGDLVFPFFSNVRDKILYDFVIALRHVPIHLIKRCQREDCGGYFLKSDKKEKRYCSNRCAWVMASRERWKLQPDVEKEKRREYYRKKKGMVQDSTSVEPQEPGDAEDQENKDRGKIAIKI